MRAPEIGAFRPGYPRRRDRALLRQGFWPFTDTVVVFGRIEAHELRQLLRELEPDEVAPAREFGIADEVLSRHAVPALAAWWD